MTIVHDEIVFDESFKSELRKKKIDQYKISYDSYNYLRNEERLVVMKKIDSLPKNPPPNFHSTIKPKVESLNANRIALSKSTIIVRENDESKQRLHEFKNLFLLNEYQNINQAIDINLISEELKFYIDNMHISIAKFHGYQLKDRNGHPKPCILAERPANGSLYSFFKFVSDKNEISMDSISSDSDEISMNDLIYNQEVDELTPEDKYILIIGIVAGIEFLHRNDRVHAQLNPSTIYIDENLHPNIVGYGFIKPEKINKKIDEYDDGEFNLQHFSSIPFIAPEIIRGKIVCQQSDIYSIGMLIYYILTGIEPFNNLSPQGQRMRKYEGSLPDFPETISEEWGNLIKSCCEYEPRSRKKAGELLSILLDPNDQYNLFASLFNTSPKFSDQQNSYIAKIKLNFEHYDDFQESYIIKDIIPDTTAISDDDKLIIIKATKQDPNSLVTLAEYFLNGEHNFPKDEYYAYKFYKEAADLKNTVAIAVKKVGEFYQNGTGTEKNLSEALKYSKKALILYQDNEVEREIIEQRINKIQKEIDQDSETKTRREDDDDDPNNDDNDYDEEEEKKDPGAIKLRERARKNMEKRQIVLINLSSSTTKQDISFFLNDYPDVIIKMKKAGTEDFAIVYFDTTDDKKDFKKKYIHGYIKRKIRGAYIDVKIKDKIIRPFLFGRSSSKKMMSEREFVKQHHKKIFKKSSSEGQVSLLSPKYQEVNLNGFYPGKNRKEYEKVGSGSYGDVYKAYRIENDELVAVKVFREDISDEQKRKVFYREINALVSLESPFIVKLIGISKYSILDHKKKNLTTIMEFIENKTLYDMIEEPPEGWNNTKKMKIIIGIVGAMQYIHDKGFIHRDLKPENIFINANYEPIIGDLGCARKVDSLDNIEKTSKVGTPVYSAPEILKGERHYDWEVDVYSFGMILYQIVTGKSISKIFPKSRFRNLYKYSQYIIDGNRPEIPVDVDPNLSDLIKKCWNNRIRKRPSFEYIFSMLAKALLEERPSTTYLPDVDINEIREYIKKIAISLESKIHSLMFDL